MTQTTRHTAMQLAPGERIEFVHRACPRCGLDLTGQLPEADGDQDNAEQVKGDAAEARVSGVPGDLEVVADSFLKRMVDPLSQAEKERTQRDEQRWLSGQDRQQTAGGQQENSQPAGHQHLIPVIERKFRDWVFHVLRFFK